MDQIKTGNLIKALRREKGVTQEQLAEQLGVSRRTVSRWETGSNLPDLDVLIELADYFDVDLRALLDGERKARPADRAWEETVRRVADYGNEEKRKMAHGMQILFAVGLAAGMVTEALLLAGQEESFLVSLCQGAACGVLFIGVMMTSRRAAKIQALKRKFLSRIRRAP